MDSDRFVALVAILCTALVYTFVLLKGIADAETAFDLFGPICLAPSCIVVCVCTWKQLA